ECLWIKHRDTINEVKKRPRLFNKLNHCRRDICIIIFLILLAIYYEITKRKPRKSGVVSRKLPCFPDGDWVARSKYIKVLSKLDKSEACVCSLHAQIRLLQDQVKEANCQIALHKKQMEIRSREVCRLQMAYTSLLTKCQLQKQERLEDEENEINALRWQLVDAESKFQTLQFELTNKEKVVQELNYQINELEELVQHMQAQLHDFWIAEGIQRDFKEENKQLVNELNELKSQLCNCAEREAVSQAINNAIGEIKELNRYIIDLEKEIQKLKEKQVDSTDLKDNKKILELQTLSQKLQKKERETNDLKQETKNLKKAIKEYEKELKMLKGKKYQEAAKMVEDDDNELTVKEEGVQTSINKDNEYEREILDLKKDNEQLQKSVKQLLESQCHTEVGQDSPGDLDERYEKLSGRFENLLEAYLIKSDIVKFAREAMRQNFLYEKDLGGNAYRVFERLLDPNVVLAQMQRDWNENRGRRNDDDDKNRKKQD
ncbi:hypothetical protein SK128_025844, partial [Halocaridina rubra]